jgi:hypothetical protein
MRSLVAVLCAAVLTFALAPSVLAVEPPPNDELTGATVVALTPDVPYVSAQDTTGATINGTDPLRTGPYIGDPPIPIGPTVWYVYTATETGVIVIDVTGSDYVPSLVMFHDDLTYMNNTFDVVVPDVVAGETYYFVIGDEDASDGMGGNLSVTIAVVPPEPVPVEAQLGVTSASIVDGQLVVTGTLATTGAYRAATLEVQAAQKGKASATGANAITDPGNVWTVSVPASTAWRAARTSLTVQVWFFVDPDEYADWTYSYVATVQAAPAAVRELGSLVGRFAVTDSASGKVISFVVETRANGTAEVDNSLPAAGQLSIKGGDFTGTYATPANHHYTWEGQPAALVTIWLPDGQTLRAYFLTHADGSQYVHIEREAAGGGVLNAQLDGQVIRKAFTITMPTT